MRVTALAGIVGILTGVPFDLSWINLIVAGVGAFTLGIFWMPLAGILLFASRAARAYWPMIASFALTYTPTQFLTRRFFHEPYGPWPTNEIIVVLWSNLWFAVIISAIGIAVWRR
jgi:hypothetical protein